MTVIDIQHLTKDYSQQRGVFDVSFSVEEGECVGFLGPNGAGKSTTIRHLLGFSKPDSGKATILGKDVAKDRATLSQVGYLPGEIALPKPLTGREFLMEQMALRKKGDIGRMESLASLFQLDLDERCGDMSLGSKRKTAIVNTFLFDPEILILDEPSSGLDPVMQTVFLDFFDAQRRKGKTVLFSSHVFAEVEKASDRVIVIKDGRIVARIGKEELIRGGEKTCVVVLGNDRDFERLSASSAFLPFSRDTAKRELIYRFEDERLPAFLETLKGLDVVDFSPRKKTLRELFLSYYKEERTYSGL